MARSDSTDPVAETTPAPGVATTAPAQRTEQLREEVRDHVLLAPQSPMTTLEIPVENGEPIRLVADGTPVPVAQVEHVVTRAALCREGVVAITPEGRVLLAPASA